MSDVVKYAYTPQQLTVMVNKRLRGDQLKRLCDFLQKEEISAVVLYGGISGEYQPLTPAEEPVHPAEEREYTVATDDAPVADEASAQVEDTPPALEQAEQVSDSVADDAQPVEATAQAPQFDFGAFAGL